MDCTSRRFNRKNTHDYPKNISNIEQLQTVYYHKKSSFSLKISLTINNLFSNLVYNFKVIIKG